MNDTNAAAAQDSKVVVKEYRLALNGLFGRNRKAKFTTEHLIDAPTEMALDDVLKLAKEKLVEMKAKPGAVYKVVETDVIVEKTVVDGRTFTSRSFMLLDGRVLHKATV